MQDINLFCFGFGQVAKEFLNNLLKHNIKVNLLTSVEKKLGNINIQI